MTDARSEEEDRHIIKLRTNGEAIEVQDRIIEFRTTCATTTSNTVIEFDRTTTYITYIAVETTNNRSMEEQDELYSIVVADTTRTTEEEDEFYSTVVAVTTRTTEEEEEEEEVRSTKDRRTKEKG